MKTLSLLGVVIGLLSASAKSDSGVVVSIHPVSTVALLPFGIYYGKVTLETSAFGADGITTAVSILHRKRSVVDTFDFLYSRTIDTLDYEKNQISLFAGKRFYHHPVYLQPTLNVGYYRYEDHQNGARSIDNMFLGTLIYCGAKIAHRNIEYSFDFGAGARVFGKNQFDAFDRLLLDGNAAIGYRF
jgi:hypothetical protein